MRSRRGEKRWGCLLWPRQDVYVYIFNKPKGTALKRWSLLISIHFATQFQLEHHSWLCIDIFSSSSSSFSSVLLCFPSSPSFTLLSYTIFEAHWHTKMYTQCTSLWAKSKLSKKKFHPFSFYLLSKSSELSKIEK